MGSLPLAPPGKPICLSSHPQSLYLYLSCYTPISVEYLSSFYSSIHHTTRYTRTHTPTSQPLSVSAPLSSRPAYPLHLLKPSMDSPRSPAPFLLPPGEPPTWLFWLCPLCAGPTAIEGLGLPLKELLLGARFLPVNITEIINPKPCNIANRKFPLALHPHPGWRCCLSTETERIRPFTSNFTPAVRVRW